jgi:predicted nuclease of predicted toxin-antitoxin system
VKLLLDENLSPNQSAIRREQGHDAVAVVDAGLSGQPDDKIREFAIAEIVCSLHFDSDFANMPRFPTAGTPSGFADFLG